MSIAFYNLTREQERKLREGVEIFGFSYHPFGFGHNIFVPNPKQKGNMRVGYIGERRYGQGGYWLEIYSYYRLPDGIRGNLKLVLDRCCLKEPEPEQ